MSTGAETITPICAWPKWQCARPAQRRGYCITHYVRAMRERILQPLPTPTLTERFWSKVNRDGLIPAHRPDLGPCWVWTGTITGRYGQFSVGGRVRVVAHRQAYELLVGPIPDGLQLDHLCRNTACVNPGHLEPVTGAENMRRSDAVTGINARKTTCIRGHEFVPRTGGGRRCLTCHAENRRRWLERKRAAA